MTEVVVTTNKPYIEVMKTAVSSINRPVPFTGTHLESVKNWNTHQFRDEFGDSRCLACDCKPWHTTASYPCGIIPPRETETVWDDGTITTEPE